ncbi:MAG: DUF1549 domain-containing protein, partial [Acidobacteriota bacterium]|nr:DUF1549 domain-containing protein [Acidobacteriota bacterium]
TDALRRGGAAPGPHTLTRLTEGVTAMLGYVPGGSRTYNFDQQHAAGSIDSYIFADLQKNGIQPAPRTTDWEFIRRVTLDLTGRIPQPERVLAFVADSSPDKRAKLIDELLASPAWVDKWTMYFGDQYRNTVTRSSSGLVRFAQGRNAFYQWIKDSLSNGKPYNQMAAELISSASTNSYTDGPANFLIGSVVFNGAPVQDVMDQMTADTFDIFLGMSHVNCLLCHNGRGHLDGLSLWGQGVTRYQAWQLSSFLSHTNAVRTPVSSSNNNVYYWSLLDNQRGYTVDYPLNTTTGNRPARQAPGGCRSGQPCFYVAPQYIFNGNAPKAGETYRAALASNITGDFQFARATVNYLWASFFGRGIVDPPDTFDPLRLDPDNPPPAPWTLQPSNARLLNALAQHFIASGYNVKAVMREIANSDTYQLSSRYNGQWSAAWEPYFARKFVRRLWGEEIVDAMTLSSGTYPSYAVTGFTDQGLGKVSFAMQFPDVVNTEGTTNVFLDTFLRGNRDDQPRKSEGSILQALNLMNNNAVVEQRLALTGNNANQLLLRVRSLDAGGIVNLLYLNILSRYPSSDEMATASASIPSASGAARDQAIQDLAWALYNKVDFIFNY